MKKIPVTPAWVMYFLKVVPSWCHPFQCQKKSKLSLWCTTSFPFCSWNCMVRIFSSHYPLQTSFVICHGCLLDSINRFHYSFLQHCSCRTSLRTLAPFVSARISRYSNFRCLEQFISIFNVHVNYQENLLRAYSYILIQHVLNEV